jgi:hypothetical protein
MVSRLIYVLDSLFERFAELIKRRTSAIWLQKKTENIHLPSMNAFGPLILILYLYAVAAY